MLSLVVENDRNHIPSATSAIKARSATKTRSADFSDEFGQIDENGRISQTVPWTDQERVS
jgi:hypothetical protein